MAKFGTKVGYNNSDGTNRNADRVGFALGAVHNGHVKVQQADGSTDEMEFAEDVARYDEEHDGNRGGVCWAV